MKTKILANPWARARGAMFKSELGDALLVFVYPRTAKRTFHTYFCPHIYIRAFDEDGTLVYNENVPPRSFIHIPPARVVIEADIDAEMPSIEDTAQIAMLQMGQGSVGGISASVGLSDLLFAVVAQSVADIRRIHEANQRGPEISPDILKLQFTPQERGGFIDAARFLLDVGDIYTLPPRAVSLSRQILAAERPHIKELFAASVGAGSWRRKFDNACLRCGKPGSWRIVIPASDIPTISAWRYQRPENAVPLCHKCAYRLKWKHRLNLRLDMAWGLWGPRFEALWRWHQAVTHDQLPQSWNVIAYPLWPRQYGGRTWASGSGERRYADLRMPKNLRRTEIHREALSRALSSRAKYTSATSAMFLADHVIGE